MDVHRRFLKDSGLAFLGRVLPRALFLLEALLVARWLGPELSGRFAYAFALMMLAANLAKFGLDTLTMREVARDPALAPRYVGHNLYLHAVLGLLGLLLLDLATLAVEKTPDTDRLVLLFGGAMLLQSLALSYTATLAALGRFDLQAALDTLLYGLMLAGAVTAMHLGAGLRGIGWATVAASALQLWACRSASLRLFGPAELRLDLGLAGDMLRMAWPLAVTGFAVTLYYRIDTVFLSWLQGDAAVGLYEAAYNLIHGLRQLPAALSMAFFPTLSRLLARDREAAVRAFGPVLALGLALGVPLLVFTSLAAEPLLVFLYRQPFAPAAPVLQVLLWTVLLMLADVHQSYLLIAAGRQRVLLGVTLLGAGANLALNAVLIPAHGMYGAALATVASEGLVLLAMQWSVADLFPWRALGRAALGPLLGLGVLLASASRAKGPDPVSAAWILVGLAAYALLLYGLAPAAWRKHLRPGLRPERRVQGKPGDGP